jgi:hypothetical protein
MLVVLFNAVKVESVPLNFNYFSATRRQGVPISAQGIGHAGRMRRLILGFLGAALMIFSAEPAQAASDEDQVRAVLDGMNSSYNGADFDSFASHLCADMRRADGFETGWYESRKTDGPTSITVMSVDVAGNPPSQAIANVRFAAANHADAKVLEVDFVRENAEWKACRYHSASSL